MESLYDITNLAVDQINVDLLVVLWTLPNKEQRHITQGLINDSLKKLVQNSGMHSVYSFSGFVRSYDYATITDLYHDDFEELYSFMLNKGEYWLRIFEDVFLVAKAKGWRQLAKITYLLCRGGNDELFEKLTRYPRNEIYVDKYVTDHPQDLIRELLNIIRERNDWQFAEYCANRFAHRKIDRGHGNQDLREFLGYFEDKGKTKLLIYILENYGGVVDFDNLDIVLDEYYEHPSPELLEAFLKISLSPEDAETFLGDALYQEEPDYTLVDFFMKYLDNKLFLEDVREIWSTLGMNRKLLDYIEKGV